MSAESRTCSTISSGIISIPPRARRFPWDSLQLHHGNTGAALVPRSNPKARHTRFLAEHFGHALAERASSLAMDDPKRLEVRADCCVDGMHNDGLYFADAHPAQVDFCRSLDFREIASHAHRHDRFIVADFHDSSHSPTKRLHLHEITDAHLGGIVRLRFGRRLAS